VESAAPFDALGGGWARRGARCCFDTAVGAYEIKGIGSLRIAEIANAGGAFGPDADAIVIAPRAIGAGCDL